MCACPTLTPIVCDGRVVAVPQGGYGCWRDADGGAGAGGAGAGGAGAGGAGAEGGGAGGGGFDRRSLAQGCVAFLRGLMRAS